jgi:hypothetical protein
VAGTTFADVIIPEVFSEYLMEPIREKNALFESGIVTYDALLASKLDVGGDVFTYPYWGALVGTSLEAPDEVLEGTVNKITADKMVVPRIFRTFNVRSTAMASILAGSDAMTAIQERVTEVWRDGLQDLFVNIATGVLASTGGQEIVHELDDIYTDTVEVTGAHLISPNAVIDAKQLLGDKGSQFKAIVLHSKVRAELEKLNLIQQPTTVVGAFPGVQISETPIAHSMFMGMIVLEDDRVPVELVVGNLVPDKYVYTTFLVIKDAFRYGDSEKGFKPVYILDQPELGMGVETLYTKKMLAFHPLGVSWTPQPGVLPEKILDADFADGLNWTYKYDPQLSGFVVLKTNG